MEEILANIAHQLHTCQILGENSEQEVDPMESQPGYVSLIKINGKPSPPPVVRLTTHHRTL